MKNLALYSFFFISFFSFSQTEKEAYKKVSTEFEKNYNLNEFEKIFDMFSIEMKKALPLEKTIEFLTNLNLQVGKIENREFNKYENGTYASYKTKFERAILALNISIDNDTKINGLFIKPFQESNLPILERNKTKLILPFNDEWTVFWGGDTKELNYHVNHKAQKNAFDIVITNEKGKSYKTDGQTNEDYYAFGKKLIAPCDAEVVLVVDGIKDNKPGELNPIYVPGNTVILKTINDEYLFFAHFKQNSIVVKQGQKIKQGDILGLCGNSGNSSEPHLHFRIQNDENMNSATGAKCFFDDIIVNGEQKIEYSPIKGELIKNN